ncbi:MAG: KEOPS complex subunit Pcc1 [Methanobacteriaceae archaeon]|nr:KEOPS complex subunit Pcc1 [Methanobacteriaceae archaeon]
MKSLTSIETEIDIEFDSFHEAETILRSIKPEIKTAPSERSRLKAYIINNRILRLEIYSEDSASFRASMNSYLRWIILSYEVLKLK